MWILFIWKLIKLPHNRWYLLLLTSTCILSFENFSMNVVYKQYFIEEISFPGIRNNWTCTEQETFATLFLLHHAALLAKKSDCCKFILKRDIYHQMSNCIKSRILNVYGLLSDCLLFCKAEIVKNFAIPNFWRWLHETSILWPKLHWLTHM